MTDNSFRDLPGYPGYVINPAGEIRRSIDSRPAIPYYKPGGRGGKQLGPYVKLTVNGKQRSRTVAKLILLAFSRRELAAMTASEMNRRKAPEVVQSFPWMEYAAEIIRTEQNGRPLVSSLPRILLKGDDSHELMWAIVRKATQIVTGAP